MNDTAYNQAYEAKMAEYKKEYAGLTAKEITDETRKRNEILAKEIYLSVGRNKLRKKVRMIKKLHEAFKAAMERGVDLNDEQKRNGVFDQAALVEFLMNKPQELEVVMTGRNPAPELVELADYVSEVCMRKHPFKRGIPARVGIEK